MVRKRIEIDEDTIRDMMRGDIPRLKHVTDESVPGNTSKEATHAAESPSLAKQEKKQERQDYASVFLKKRERSVKRQTYIDQDIYTKIAGIPRS